MSSTTRPTWLAPLMIGILGCAAAWVAVSSQSIWIDEAQTARQAAPGTLAGWWQAAYGEHNSNMQMPLYMLYVWGWARLFGLSEVALRAANIPWFFVGLFAIYHFLRRHPGLRNATALLYCVHPFVWYYMNEARPYRMQLSGALLVCGALFAAMDEPEEPLSRGWWWLFAAGMTILCGAGLLGIPWAIAITLFVARLPNFRQSMTRTAAPALAVFLPVLLALALYFAWTIKEKLGSGRMPMNLPSVLSAFYEQLGFLGLGPGRSVLRVASLPALRPYVVPLLLLGLPLAWGLFMAARRRFGLSQGGLADILLLTGSPVLLVFAMGFARDVRILARHLTPLFPFILLAQACAVVWLWKSGRTLGRAAAVLIVAALTVSSLEVRFAFRHSKDDYRAATAAANEALAGGKTVWWAADVDCAAYYRLPLAIRNQPGAALWVDKVPASIAAPPDQIFLSKPDLCDPTGTLSAYIAAHHYVIAQTWQTFTVWQPPAFPR